MNQTEETFPRFDEPQPPAERPSPIPGVTWGMKEIVLGVFGAIMTIMILALILTGVASVFDEDSLEANLLGIAALAFILNAVLIATVLIVVGSKGAGLRELGIRPPAGSWPGLLGKIVLAYLGASVLVRAYFLAIDLFGLEALEPDQQLPDDFYTHDLVVGLTGLAVVFLTPVAEELFFRGFIYGGLRRYLNLPLAALISGLLFSLAHGDPGFIIPFGAIGFVLAYVYERSGTLYAPIGVHFIFNGVSFVLGILFPELR